MRRFPVSATTFPAILKTDILIISPEYPPERGGIADHTERLARLLSSSCNVSVLTSKGGSGRSAANVHAEIGDWSDMDALYAAMEGIQHVDVVIWQYVPHMYGRGGVNLKLPRALLMLQKHHRSQIVLAHEIAAPYSAWPHRLYYAWAHRSQWRRMVNIADSIGISTEAWLDEWRHLRPDAADKMFLAPSPSNIDVAEVAPDHRSGWRAAQGLKPDVRVMGYFGTVSDAKQFHWVTEAWQSAQAGGPTALVVIGGKPEFTPPAALTGLYREPGFLPSAEVSKAMQAIDVLVLPFVDGASERRTSFMAGLIHGCPVVSTIGHNTGGTLRAADWFAHAPTDDPEGFTKTACRMLDDRVKALDMGRRAADFYARHYDWMVLGRLLEAQMV